MTQVVQHVCAVVAEFIKNIVLVIVNVAVIKPGYLEVFRYAFGIVAKSGAAVGNFVLAIAAPGRLAIEVFAEHQRFFNVFDNRAVLVKDQFIDHVFELGR